MSRFGSWLDRQAWERLGKRGIINALMAQTWETTQGRQDPDPQGAFLKAFQCAVWVWTCISVKATFAGQVPLKHYRLRKGQKPEEKEELPFDHPLCQLMQSINGVSTRSLYWQTLIGNLCLRGNAYILKTGPDGEMEYGTKAPSELWHLRPDSVTPCPNAAGNKVDHYLYRLPTGETWTIPPEQMIHPRLYNPYDLLVGQSEIRALQNSITTDITAQNYNRDFLKNQARPVGIIKFKKFVAPKQLAEYRKEWNKAHAGAKAGSVSVIADDADYQETGMSQKDIDFFVGRNVTRDEIVAGLHCYPAVVAIAQADRSRAEADWKMFAYNTMAPMMNGVLEWHDEFLSQDFAGPNERIISAWDYSQVPAMKDDEVAKATIVSQLTQGPNPVLTPNEARKIYLKLEDRPDGAGDQVLVNWTLVPAGDVGGLSEQTPAEKAASQKARADAPIYTESQIKRWHIYERRVTGTEKQARKWLGEMFEAQKEACLTNLARGRSQRNIDDIIDEVELAKISDKALMRVLLAAMEQGLEHGKEPLGIELSFDLKNPKLVSWLETHVYESSKYVNDTTTKALRVVISDAIEKGGTLSEITDRVESAMSAMFDEAKAGRALTIARTEVQIGMQHTQQEVWLDSQVVELNGWISSMSPNMRDTHGAQNGVEVPVGSEFPNGCTYPGDPAADPGESINCLCDMYPVVNAQAKADWWQRRLESQVYPVTGKGGRKWQTSDNLKNL